MKIDRKISLIVFYIFAVAIVGLRLCQLVFNFNFNIHTLGGGFEIDVFGIVFLAGTVLLLVILAAGASRDKVVGTARMINPMRIPIAELSQRLTPACGLLFMGLFAAVGYEIVAEFLAMRKAESVRASSVIMMIFMLFSAFNFLATSISILDKKGISKGCGGWFIIASIMHIIIALRIIMDVPLLAGNTEQLLIMLGNILASAFYITAARLFLGFEKAKTRVMLAFWGYLLSAMQACSVIPRFALFFLGSDNQLVSMETPRIMDAILIILPIMIITIFWGEYKYKEMPKMSLKVER